jgi:hypothetical protein
MTDEVAEWLAVLKEEDPKTWKLVVGAIDLLKEGGPGLGRPAVDKIKGSSIKRLKELRPGSSGRSKVRILFVFDPWRQAILLVAGDKSSDWKNWYNKALKDAERLYAEHLRAQDNDQETDHRDRHHEHPELGRRKGRAGRRPRGGGSPRR